MSFSATAGELGIGVALDLAIGDPKWLPHPVRAIAALIEAGERLIRPLFRPRFAGVLVALGVVGISAGVAWFTVRVGGSIAVVYWIFSCLAIRSLDQEAGCVISWLRKGDLKRARRQVAQIVGRDTDALSEREITRAAFETVAENISDGIIAPIFFLIIGGAPAMVAYKAINTLDSMVGYKNEKYIDFGWASAKLDDIANYVPARLSAALIVLVAALLRCRWRQAILVTWRDARLQPSPNAGYPEAAMAGALGVQLGGLNFYFGRPVQKPALGDPVTGLDWRQFTRVRTILYGVSVLAVLAAALVLP